MYSEQIFAGGRLALATGVRKDLTVVNPQWTELFLSCNVKTMKFGMSFCPFHWLAQGTPPSARCLLWFSVPGFCVPAVY